MAAWPDLDELKQVLDVTSDDWDGDLDNTRFTRLLAAAIDGVKARIAGTAAGYDAIYTEPTEGHAQAALRMAELLATRPTDQPDHLDSIIREDATLGRLLFGQRRRFGVA